MASADPVVVSGGAHAGSRVHHHHHHQFHSHQHHLVGDAADLNPMDFIDNDVSPPDDDVFVNLDAFDMLGDFPELEVLEQSAGQMGGGVVTVGGDPGLGVGLPVTPTSDKTSSQSSSRMDYREGTANITDYSPEWAYPEGGVKVLVTGPWYSTTSPYTVLFDAVPVPTTLVQSGVLRCFCPAHEVGLATLQVACEGFVISNSVIFEYKKPPKEERGRVQEPKTAEHSNDNLLRFTLLQRLEAMDNRLLIKQEPDGAELVEGSSLFNQGNFEDRMVTYCQEMTSKMWLSNEEVSPAWFESHRGMTLLHLAASLGYSRLVCAMLQWRAENSSLLLETEVDALSQDDDGFTPLMWACARGHRETALVLYQWNHTALNLRNHISQTPTECARFNNHFSLAEEINRLEVEHHQQMPPPTPTPTPSPLPSPSYTPTLMSDDQPQQPASDGVFLRPGAVTRSESQKYKMLSMELHVNIPPDGSGVGGPCSSLPSPTGSTSSAGEGSTGSNGSGISSSRPHRLAKRPSVDSGIHLGTSSLSSSTSGHMNMGDNCSNTYGGLKFRGRSGRETPKLSRFDRSMSLPLNSPVNIVDSSTNDSVSSEGQDLSRMSPVRRMDFALCEVVTGPRSESPVIDVEAVSDEESSEAKQSIVGEQDVRVLALAEQIIAAIPERIKNESEEMMSHESSPQPESASSSHSSHSLPEPFLEPMMDEPPSSSFEPVEFNFEFSDQNYRYYDVGTPSSSLSPASSGCLQSPCSFTLDSPTPPPTTADFCEFFQASGSMFEKDFSNLTLSDREQRELYEAAKIIQKAYRSYKGRKKLEEQDKERAAAILIQNYYRRYKQYAYFKQMTKAAMVIQNQFRSYCEHKRFKKSQEAAVCIQNYYRNYREQERGRQSREGTPTGAGLKRTYSQRRQHQAARKIQQFMRQSKNNLWDVSPGNPIAERTCLGSRKREAGGPVIIHGGCPAKVALSRQFGLHRSK